MYANRLMYKTQIIIFIVSALLVMASTSWAATYYVDIDHPSASDAGPGTKSKPWKRCPGMVGWSGSARLLAGDTVYFDSGDTWTAASGKSFLQVTGGVTYDGSAWGSGTRAELKAKDSFSRAVVNFMDDDPIHETVIRGFNVNINEKSTSGVTVNWPNSSKNLTGAMKRIEDCVIHDIDATPSSAEYGIKVGAVSGKHTYNVEVLNCIVYNTSRTGIVIYPALSSSECQVHNATVRGCEIYATGLDVNGSVGHGISVKNNVQGCIVEYNSIYNCPGRGISVTNTAGIAAPQDVKIRYNIVSKNGKGGVYIAHPGDKEVDIYGNLIFKNRDTGSGGSGIYFEGDLSGNIAVKIYNNTLYQNANGEILIAKSSANFTKLDIKNNIMYSKLDKYVCYDISGGRITGLSNNLYYRPGDGSLVRDGGTYYTKSNIGSWESNALVVDPLLQNVSNLPRGFTGSYGDGIRPNTDGLDIDVKSKAKAAGTSLGATYSGSINNVSRSDNWDLGAYQGACGLTTGAPSSLMIVY